MVLQDSENQKSYVKCPLCGKDAHKLYKPEDYEGIKDINLLFEMKRTYQCDDKEKCANVFQLSKKEIMNAFERKLKEEKLNRPELIKRAGRLLDILKDGSEGI